MTTCCGNLQGTLHTLLPLHLGKVEVEGILLFVELLTSVNNRRLIVIATIKKTDHISQTIHAKDVEAVDYRSFADILLGNDKPLEFLRTRPDGYGQGTTDGFQAPVESQFTNHHIVVQVCLADLPMGC